MKDPYYRKILEGLDGPLDPTTFQECAVALLRAAYLPGLVLIHGGRDYGMDGAIADGEGEPYPLIVTTAEDVSGNLRNNLTSYLEGGGPRRQAVLATSRALTPTRRRNLHGKSQEQGFTLLQIHDQRDFADRLYRNSDWTKELLGLEGRPAALSAVPRARGPVRHDVELIGREADLSWLRETSGDRLVLGQPGAGKTFLLLQLVRDGEALFLASDDETQIAEGLRDLRPSLVIVDDAHRDPEQLVRLRQLRDEIDWEGHFVATAWPGARDEVASALDVGSSRIRKLELLSLKQILEVLRGLGIDRPEDDPLLGFLVHQSANKPGLAVILGSLWLRGELWDLVSGEGIRRSLLPSLKEILGADPTQLLACFALGGEGGMDRDAVAEFLGMGRGEVGWQVSEAAHGGLLRVPGRAGSEGPLIVEPDVLRSALIERVSSAPGGSSFLGLVERAPAPGKAVEGLAVAALRGAPVPEDRLRELLAEHGTPEAWRNFAQLGRDQARWVLEEYPGRLADVARAALTQATREAVGRLIAEAVDAAGEVHSTPGHSLRILQDWIQGIPFLVNPPDRFDPAESLHRRRLVVEVATARNLSARAFPEGRAVAVRAALIALNPELEESRPTATGAAVRLHRAVLPASAAGEILCLWSQVLPEVQQIHPEVWLPLKDLIRAWITPTASVGEEGRREMHSVAERILRDIASVPELGTGLRSSLAEMAARLDLDLGIELDQEFETLFPGDPLLPGRGETYAEARERRRLEARKLAESWAAQKAPEDAARRLRDLEEEAGHHGNQLTDARWAFARALAELVTEPAEWLLRFVEHGVEPFSLQHLLARVVRDRAPGWRDALEACLLEEDYQVLAADAVVRAEGLPPELLEAVIPHLKPQLVENACFEGAVPDGTLEALLEHPEEEISVAAAVGEWLSDPEKSVRPAIRDPWRRAILRAGATTEIDQWPEYGVRHWLQVILEDDDDLALEWLMARIRDAGEYEGVRENGAYRSALRNLAPEQRQTVLRRLAPGYLASRLIPWLVGGSADAYEVLLSREDLSPYHLGPLAGGPPDAEWETLAGLALDAGYGPETVADAAYGGSHFIGGFGVEYWSQWKSGFEDLHRSAEGGLREVAAEGLRMAEARIEIGEEERRQFELTGWF